PEGRPPDMPVWNVFFDKPASRPYQTYKAELRIKRVRVSSRGKRATIAIGDLAAGPFSGELQTTFFAGSPLILVEAVVATQEDRRAIIYDAGLVSKLSTTRR